MDDKSKTTLSKLGSVALVISAAILLFLAQSASWLNHTVFDKETFTDITTTALLSESSRDSIASAVVNEALQDRPVLERVIGDRAVVITSGLLGSDLSTRAVTALSDKTYTYVTTENRQDIKIDLTSIKTVLDGLVAVVQKTGNDSSNIDNAQAKIPDEIILIESDAFPDLSGTVQLSLVLGPIFWLSSISLFAAYIYIGRAVYAHRVYMVGLAVFIVAVFGLLAPPFVPPAVAAAIPNVELRQVAENLATGFLTPFKNQMMTMLIVDLVALGIFSQRFNILRGIRSLETKLVNQAAKKATKK